MATVEVEVLTPDQQLRNAIDAGNIKDVIVILAEHPRAALQVVEGKYNLLHLISQTIVQGVLKSPDAPLSEEARTHSENFDTLTVNIGTLVTIGIILIRHGIDPTKRNLEDTSPLDLLNDGTGNTYGFGEGFFLPKTITFLTEALGISVLYDNSEPKTHKDLSTLFALEGALYKQLQQLPGLLKQFAEEIREAEKHAEDEAILKELTQKYITLQQLMEAYTKTIFEPRHIDDLCDALDTIKSTAAYAILRSQTHLLEADLLCTSQELNERGNAIAALLTKSISAEQRRQLLEYQLTILSLTDHIPNKTSKAKDVEAWLARVKLFLQVSAKYLTSISSSASAEVVVDPSVSTPALKSKEKPVKKGIAESSIILGELPTVVAVSTSHFPRVEHSVSLDASPSAVEMEAFTTFLQNLKDGNERLVREQLQRNPAFLMLGLITAAKAMQVNYCQFLIRLGASPTIKVQTLEGNYTASDHLARELAAASVPSKTIEAVLLLLAREEQLFLAMEQLRKTLETVDTSLSFTVIHKEWLQKYRTMIEPLVTRYQGDLFNAERTRSRTEALIGEVTALISAFADKAPLLKEEQLKIKVAAIEAARKQALELGLSPITLAPDQVHVDAPDDSQPIEEMVEVVRRQMVSISVARSVDSVPLGDLPSQITARGSNLLRFSSMSLSPSQGAVVDSESTPAFVSPASEPCSGTSVNKVIRPPQ